MRGRKGIGDVPVYDMEMRVVSMLVRDFAIIVGAGDEHSQPRKTSRQQSLPGPASARIYVATADCPRSISTIRLNN